MVKTIEGDFHKRRAEALGYVYFSRLNNLIIKETGEDSPFFDYLIDIGDSHKRQTGRLFGISIKAFQNGNLNKKVVMKPYKDINFPIIHVFFDTHKDKGFYNWIKKPLDKGDLKLEKSEQEIEELNNDSIKSIVEKIDEWYAHKKN
jgi:hypothetical protein